jgi:iron complex outermembrane receptor protein
MKHMTGAIFALVAPLCCAQAAETSTENDSKEKTFTLGVVEVIGEAVEKPAPGVETVTADDIAKQDRRDVAEALNLLPGVTVQNIGQRRERMIWIRGFNSRQVPIYIDGVPVYVPYDGNIDLARFGVDTLSQIVVTKGLTSVLYGPNALGGSVNLVSRRPTAPFEASAYAGFDLDREGDDQGYRSGGRIATNQGTWYAQATASMSKNDYFRLPSDFRATPNEDGGRRNNSASDDRLFTAKFGWTPNATDEYSLNYYRQDGEKQDPPYAGTAPGVSARFWRWPDWNKESLYFISRTALGDSTDLRLRAYYDSFYNQLDSYDNASYTTQTRPYAFSSTYDDFTTGASAELEQRWSPGQTTRIALHNKRDVHREVSAVGAPLQHFIDKTTSIAVEHEWKPVDAWTITPGVSYNRLEGVQADNLITGTIMPFAVETNSASNAQIAVSYALDDANRLFAGVSRKTRFPTLKDRYSYRMGSALPNPDLAAERSTNIELGYEGGAGVFHYRAALFQSRLTDAIDAITLAPTACTSPPCSQLQNIGVQRNRGIELSGDVDLTERLRIAASYTLLDRDNLSRPEVTPTDTPREKLFATISYDFATNWSVVASADSESRRYSSTNAARIAPGFTLYDTRVRWQAHEHIGVSAGVRNITDKRYMYEEGYPEAGRTYTFQIDYRY